MTENGIRNRFRTAGGGAGARSSPTSALLTAWRYYGRELVRHKCLAGPALLAPACATVCQLYLIPLVVAGIVGRVAGNGDSRPSVLAREVAAFAGLLATAELLWRIGVHCLNRVQALGIEHLHTIAMDELLGRDMAFFHTNMAGAVSKRAIGFAQQFEEFAATLSFEVIATLLPLGVAAIVLWHYDPMLVAVLAGLILIIVLVAAPLVRRRQALVDVREAAAAATAGYIADTVSNMPVLRAFTAESARTLEHRRRIADYRTKALHSWDYSNLRIDIVTTPLVILTNIAGLLIALQAHHGRANVQLILIAFSYYWNATAIVFRFNLIYRQVESALTEAAQFTALLSTPAGVTDPEHPLPLRQCGTDIRFERVHFTPPGGPPLFRGFDLTVPAGNTIGLVGRSGAGKTTLAQLLLRMMDIDDGTILVGGQDISRLRQADLRSLIAYVPQETALLHSSLADNIRIARPAADDELLRRAAEAAHVTEFADQLPEGMDTVVGERGVKLSGGQRQRVALARAVLRDAPILILDEATSALDTENEYLIQQALSALMHDRTALVIAHRLSTTAAMDHLVVLDQGRIVEQGTHRQLLDADGMYARMWRHQICSIPTEQTPNGGRVLR